VLTALAFAIAAAAAGVHLALVSDAGITGVAIATAAANGLYFALLVGDTVWRELNGRERTRFAFALCLTLLPTIGVACALPAAVDLAESWRSVAAHAAAVSLVWSLTMLLGWRCGCWGGARQDASE
jgi:hypothetical protein